MTDPGWLSVLPPVLAIVLAIWTKQVYLSLFFGIWFGWTILASWNPIVGLRDALDSCINVFSDAGNTRVILFSALVGALITLTQRSGGMEGFVNMMTRRGLVKGRKSAGLLAWFVGLCIFVESSITCLVVGSVSRPIFDRLKISREKLAYICDSTSAPVCILIPLNAWGAYIIGLLTKEEVAQPVAVLVKAIPLNFYAIVAVAMVLYIVLTDRDFGPMAKAEQRARQLGKVLRDGAEPMISTEVIAIETKPGLRPRSINMIIPVATMVLMMPVGLLITGKGNLMAGSGSTAVFWAVLTAIAVAAGMYMAQRFFTLREVVDLTMKGIGGLVPLAILMILAFSIGSTCKELGTGPYVAGVTSRWIHPNLLPPIVFLVACFIAFSTGTSWGTFAIMLPIAIPMVTIMQASLPLTVSAVLGGGVFGDHCSPISDTTIVSSMASASDHIDHVRTQLPYALTAAVIAVIIYLLIAII
jgi:tetracycline resistance efflux pump